MIAYNVFYRDWPLVKVHTKRDPIFVKILDPCQDKDIRQRPELCQAKGFLGDRTPAWINQLGDRLIAFGQDYVFKMGEPVNSYGWPVDVEVNLREASSFATFTGGSQNAIILDGNKMKDPDKSHYWVTIEVFLIDSFGMEKYYRRDINLIVINVAFPSMVSNEIVIFKREDPNFVMSVDLQELDDLDKQKRRPKPVFVGLTKEGEMRIRWDAPMAFMEDSASLLESRKVLVPYSS